jgi:hypothetical protein
VPITVHVREYSWVVDRNEGHLNEVRERVVISELCEVLAIIDVSIVSYSIWIGYENVPMHWFISSGGSEDVWLLVLDGKADEREGSETFVSGEMARVEREEVE